ncbi:hypothetical protein ABE905_00675, partial [Enterococcus durans]
LISEGVASAPTVYSFLKNKTKVFLIFVPASCPNYSKISRHQHHLTMSQHKFHGSSLIHVAGFLQLIV